MGSGGEATGRMEGCRTLEPTSRRLLFESERGEFFHEISIFSSTRHQSVLEQDADLARQRPDVRIDIGRLDVPHHRPNSTPCGLVDLLLVEVRVGNDGGREELESRSTKHRVLVVGHDGRSILLCLFHALSLVLLVSLHRRLRINR